MKAMWKTIRLGFYIFVLPLVAITAVSAHQMISDDKPVDVLVTLDIIDASQSGTLNSGTTNIGTLRNHTLAVDEDGIVRGRIVNIEATSGHVAGLENLKVSFAQNGRIACDVITGPDGNFESIALTPGAYSLVAAGETGFAAYGVNIVEANAGGYQNVMEAAAVSPGFTAVREVFDAHVLDDVKAKTQLAELNDSRSFAGSSRVQLVDGDLLGNVGSITGSPTSAAGTVVHIIQNDAQVNSVKVGTNGSFRVRDLEPGVYDFVAAGPSGFAAVGFEAVRDDMVSGEFVNGGVARYEPTMSLDVAMTAPADGAILGGSVGFACDACGQTHSEDYIASPMEYAGQTVGCGTAAGGACGEASNFSSFNGCNSRGTSARGFGGSGGVQRLAGLGLLAWAIAEVGDDNNPGDLPPSPINP